MPPPQRQVAGLVPRGRAAFAGAVAAAAAVCAAFARAGEAARPDGNAFVPLGQGACSSDVECPVLYPWWPTSSYQMAPSQKHKAFTHVDNCTDMCHGNPACTHVAFSLSGVGARLSGRVHVGPFCVMYSCLSCTASPSHLPSKFRYALEKTPQARGLSTHRKVKAAADSPTTCQDAEGGAERRFDAPVANARGLGGPRLLGSIVGAACAAGGTCAGWAAGTSPVTREQCLAVCEGTVGCGGVAFNPRADEAAGSSPPGVLAPRCDLHTEDGVAGAGAVSTGRLGWDVYRRCAGTTTATTTTATRTTITTTTTLPAECPMTAFAPSAYNTRGRYGAIMSDTDIVAYSGGAPVPDDGVVPMPKVEVCARSCLADAACRAFAFQTEQYAFSGSGWKGAHCVLYSQAGAEYTSSYASRRFRFYSKGGADSCAGGAPTTTPNGGVAGCTCTRQTRGGRSTKRP